MNDNLFIRKTEGLFTRVDSRVVILVEASGGWPKIITQEGVHLVSSTLSQLEELLPVALFLPGTSHLHSGTRAYQ